ncbi:MSHA biogenesis protein MshQ [Oceanimonas sp. GK1]|uniref:hypothetical protein n=1 Tax=Oceanimonas sp. (strain GK1 / IBRC-M 10197) TaxID=511062 RepID=UPI0002494EE4|nr:hypothetical protein [Oceanimonas sp. GK1]AEY01694.1 MSHA biogenesis protein MshQ [Oceanimonas sp. GK1]
MKHRNWLYIASLALPLPTLAADMASLFPYAAQSHSDNGTVDMNWSTQIVGTRNGKIDFNKKDDLNGECDGKSCKITGDIIEPYALPAFNTTPFTLPDFKTTSTNFKAECGGSGSIKYTRSEYKNVATSGSCDIHLANNGDVVIDEGLSAQGSGDLYLAPGNYWMGSFSLSGSSRVIASAPGEINLYVKKQVKLEGSTTLGSTESEVNLFYYDDGEIKLEGSRTWFGNIQTRGELEIGGSSELYGAVQAGSLSLSGSARLYQKAGEYWFEDLELKGSARLMTVGSRPSRFYVRDELELEGSAELGKEGQSLLVLVYGEQDSDGDDGEADLEGSSKLYGHLYLQGDLEMKGSSRIYGGVNVVDLEMEGSSAIYARALEEGQSTAVHHYELHFNGCSEQLTAYACANESCSEQYTEKAKLHVKANGSNLANFNKIYGSESQSLKKTPGYPFTMVVQSDGKGGNMDPDADYPLVCYVNGEKTCTVTSAGSDGDSGPLVFEVDTAYAAGEAAVRFTGGCLAEDGEVEVAFGFDGTASGDGKSATLNWPGGGTILQVGKTQTLTLPVTGASLSYPYADLLTLSVQQVLPDGGLGSRLTDKVAFVPESWRVQQAAECDDQGTFLYEKHAGTCTVLGAAGEELVFSVAALDMNGQPLPLGWLADRISSDLIYASLENGALQPSQDYALNDDGDGATASTHQFASEIVGRLSVKVEGWNATYIPDDDNLLPTNGDSAFVGRSVPASLKVTETQNGDINGDIVYASKPGVSFDVVPSFTVIGLDVNGKELPSYSGEFAGGLKGNTSLGLGGDLDLEALTPTIVEPETGKHVISLDTSKLKFNKAEPFPETDLDLPILLTINKHDETQGVDAAKTTLAQENDTLRFGFVTLMDSEIKVDEAGTMASKLNYFGKDVQTVLEDKVTGYDLEEATSVTHEPMLDPELLTLARNEVKVSSHGEQHKGIQVSVDGLPDWLKPADQDEAGELTDPVGMLDILNNPRLRASDSTFNRREVFR